MLSVCTALASREEPRPVRSHPACIAQEQPLRSLLNGIQHVFNLVLQAPRAKRVAARQLPRVPLRVGLIEEAVANATHVAAILAAYRVQGGHGSADIVQGADIDHG